MNDEPIQIRSAPIDDLRRARSWIARWQKIRGGFNVDIGPLGPIVRLARRTNDDPVMEKVRASAADALERELTANPKTWLMVCALARASWERTNVANDTVVLPANDTDDTLPEPPSAA